MAAEKQFENKIKNFLNENKEKIWWTKIWGGGFQKSGIPDLLLCVNGIFISVEVKSSIGHPSELQKWNTRRINSAGGVGVILYPEGFDDFKNLIREVLNCSSHTAELNVLKNVHTSTKCVILIS